jgi:hypothetical protein
MFMDQNYPSAETLSYSTRAPVVMIGAPGSRLDRAISLVAGAGLRSVEPVPISHARERLAQQASASAVWIELEGAFEQATGDLLDAVDQDVANGRYAAIVSATATLIDPVFAHVAERSIEVIVDADDQQRAAALALAMSGAGVRVRVGRRSGPECGSAPAVERRGQPHCFDPGPPFQQPNGVNGRRGATGVDGRGSCRIRRRRAIRDPRPPPPVQVLLRRAFRRSSLGHAA